MNNIMFHVVNVTNSIAIMYCINIVCNKLSIKDTTSWHIMHLITNAYITCQTSYVMTHILSNPLTDINAATNNQPICSVIGLHIAHILIYRNKMTFTDWWHHFLNCFMVGFIILYYNLGIMVNYFLFYMCGLPGGIDYLLLIMKDFNIINKLTEKRINKFLNMWIRMPGILYGCVICWIYSLSIVNYYYKYTLYFIVASNMFNAIYFASLVTENYGENKKLINLKQEYKIITI